MSARTLFGVANCSQNSTSLLIEEPIDYNDNFLTYSEAITALIESDSQFNKLFSPFYELYYIGPMGGYGENLRSYLAGYHIDSSSGISLALELRQINTPMINTPDELRQFIKQTPMKTRAIAIINHADVMNTSEKDFYAVVYEKHTDSDVLYAYTSIDLESARSFFRSKFILLTPDYHRQCKGIRGLYAIQDAIYLESHLNKKIDAPMSLDKMQYQFHLDKKRFDYNEKSLMQDHVLTMQEIMKEMSRSMSCR